MKNITLTLASVLLFTLTYAQKAVLKSGSFSALKGQKELNLVYDYDALKIGTGKKAKAEEDYIKEKVEEYNKKEAGKGDSWKVAFKGDRDRVYHVKFEELLNKGLEKSGIKASRNNSGAKYTLHVKTTRIEPGWNIGVSKYPAFVDLMFTLTETGSTTALGVAEQLNNPGAQAMGFDYDSSTRISEGYAKGAKVFAGFLAKQIK